MIKRAVLERQSELMSMQIHQIAGNLQQVLLEMLRAQGLDRQEYTLYVTESVNLRVYDDSFGGTYCSFPVTLHPAQFVANPCNVLSLTQCWTQDASTTILFFFPAYWRYKF